MSKRKLRDATSLEVPGLYRVTWSVDVEAATHDEAAAMARAVQMRRGAASFDVERVPDVRQGAFLFGVGARRIMVEAGAGAPEPKRGAKVERAARPTVQPGLAWAEGLLSACLAAQAAHGERWGLVAGASVLVTLPAALRSYRSERGTVIRTRRDARVPAARFWPGGALPAGATEVPDYDHAAPANDREVRWSRWDAWAYPFEYLRSCAADARKVWLGLLDVKCRQGFANRDKQTRAEMRKAAADFWRMRRMALLLAPLKPEKVRKGDRDILAGDVLCPTGAITDAYTAWLSAWQEANPDRNVDQTGQADWLNEQKRGGAFRYDGET